MGNTDKENGIIRTQNANTRAHILDDGDLDPWEDITEETDLSPLAIWEDVPEESFTLETRETCANTQEDENLSDPWEDIPEPWEANVEPWEDIPEPWDPNPTNKNFTI